MGTNCCDKDNLNEVTSCKQSDNNLAVITISDKLKACGSYKIVDSVLLEYKLSKHGQCFKSLRIRNKIVRYAHIMEQIFSFLMVFISF